MSESVTHVNASSLRQWIRHITSAPPLRRTNHMNKSCHTYESYMLHIWMSHVTRVSSDPRATCATQYTMSMSHVAHMNGSCRIYEWVMWHTYERDLSHIWMKHATHMNASCHIYEWVVSHIWMSHVTHMNESWHPYECVLSQMRICCVVATKRIVSSDVNVIFTCVCVCVQIRATWRVRTHTHTHKCGVSHIWKRHVAHMNEACHTYRCITSLHVTYPYVWYMCITYVTYTDTHMSHTHIHIYHTYG